MDSLYIPLAQMIIMVFENLLSVGYIITLLISSIVAFIAILIVDKVVGGNFEPKHAFIMAIVALFISPIVLGFIFSSLSLPTMVVGTIDIISGFILPLLIWITLGEALLSADKMAKLKVTVIAFVVYLILSIFVTPMIFGLLP